MRSWFKGGSSSSRPSSILSPSRNASNTHVAADPREVEASDLAHAMEAASRILNDDIEGAEAQLRSRKDSSSYHQLGLGIAVFVRSILGFEKDIMAEAASRLAECESRAWSDMRKAQKLAEGGGAGWFRGGSGTSTPNGGHVSGKGCEIYPAGTEFQLLNAEAQLMSAMISVMHESLTEAIKGFYKLRKAFIALDAIMEAEAKVLAAHQGNGVAEAPALPAKLDAAEKHDDAASDSDLEFVDAPEDTEQTQKPTTYDGHLEKTNGNLSASSDVQKSLANLSLDNPTALSAPPAATGTISTSTATEKGSKGHLASPPRTRADAGPDSSLFSNPVDAFVHSGANMCFGILLLIISMVPPAFSRLLYIIGFKGDRERGVSMLWQSTKFNNVNGGVAGLMLLAYYNGLLAFSDILPSSAEARSLAGPGEIVGYPKEECITLLDRMRSQYPESRMWKVEEARVLANARRLREAVELLEANGDSKMRQVTALNTFELSVNALFLMRWETSRAGFLRCVELNDWSHSLYYFFVGAAEIEMYRDCAAVLAAPGGADERERATLEADMRRHKRAAEEYLRKAPAAAGRKKFLARQMPFEVYALRKVAKWEARAKEWQVDLADAVGPSPGEEMTYLWTGAARMDPGTMEKALACLSWERCTAPAARVEEMRSLPDEAAIKAVAETALLANLGRYAEAREKVKPLVDMDR